MKQRISKRVREQAALGCQLCASNSEGVFDARNALAVLNRAADVAVQAFYGALGSVGGSHIRLGGERWQHWEGQWAEAEAMLRTGWTP